MFLTYLMVQYIKVDGMWKWFVSIPHSSFLWTWFPSTGHFIFFMNKVSIHFAILMDCEKKFHWLADGIQNCKKIVNMTSKNCIDMASVISKMLLGKIPLKFHSNGILQFASLFIFHHSGRSGSNIHGEGGLGDVAQVTYTGQEGKVEEEDQEENQWHRNCLPGQHVEGRRGRYKRGGGREMGRILPQ